MVKYNHCEKCKSIYSTTPWIGEVHTYEGICPSCEAEEQQKGEISEVDVEDQIVNELDVEHIEEMQDLQEITHSSPLEIDKDLLSNLEQKASSILSGEGSVDVLIKEIKDDVVGKARERIEETFQSFDAGKIDAQKVVDSAERILDYLSEYQDYMDRVVKKIQDKPKMKVKIALEKVYKESMSNIAKDVAKDSFLNKKTMIKTVYGKAVKWYNIYSNIEDVSNLTKKMALHPFNEIQKKLSTLPFYTSN
ncbi:MAG: hypothetical protein ACFFBE_16325 [Promethearchaeota archaeon]